MINKSIIYTLLSIALITSCKNKTTPDKTELEIVQGLKLPGLPDDIRTQLRSGVTAVDYSFNSLPISLSQNLEDGVQQNVEFISSNVPDIIPTTCKPIAHKYYSVNGDIFLDADLYFTENCKFYVFTDGNKPLYANFITDQGITFYTNVINNAMKPNPYK